MREFESLILEIKESLAVMLVSYGQLLATLSAAGC